MANGDAKTRVFSDLYCLPVSVYGWRSWVRWARANPSRRNSPIPFALLSVQFVKDPTKPQWPECYSTGVLAIPVSRGYL